ncbi:MAG: ATP-binding protein [Cellvibrionaceae bacterium]
MKLPHFSIQVNLLIALVVLSGLVVLSSIIAWLAFDRVSANQKVLLSQSLPEMRFVDQTVDVGLELLELSASLNRVLSSQELSILEQRAQDLFVEIEKELQQYQDDQSKTPFIDSLQTDTERQVANIQQQLELQRVIVSDANIFLQEKTRLLSTIDAALIDIKLVSSELSLESLELSEGNNLTDINFQMAALQELRFEVQNIKAIVVKIEEANSVSIVEREEDLYRLTMQGLGSSMLEFKPKYRTVLAKDFSILNDVLSKENNIFSLTAKQLERVNRLNDIQKNNASLNKKLTSTYNAISKDANDNLDVKAQDILKVVATSKVILVITVVVSLITVLIFSLLFIKPRLVNRLLRLRDNTRAIANNHYSIDIDTSGDDEISAMATSLAYFRDQLVEKESVQTMLADREKALSTIINNAVEGLFTVDIQGVIRTFNPACEHFFDAGADMAIGENIKMLLPHDMDVFSAHSQRAAGLEGDGYIVCQERKVSAYRYNGEEFFGSLSVSLINLSGRHAYSCFLRDVTREHKDKEKIEALVDKLMLSNSDLERFAYSCSHDLQEPVRMVMSFSELLQARIGDTLDEKSTKYLDYILKGALSAKQLIKDMLDYSRLDQTTTKKEWMSVSELCQQVEVMIVATLEQSNGRFEYQKDELKIYVVAPQMVQLLTNLITNGLKYNDSDKPEVNLSVIKEDNHWLICVQDNGIGIDPRYNEKIFEVFSRLVSKREYDGSGIGLSICQKIVEKHDGKIWVESELGKGSEFYVRLPIKSKL